MHPLLALALVIIAGVGITRLSRPTWRAPAPLRTLSAAGAPFILLGVLLGPGLVVLDDAALRPLAPLLALGCGWIGAALGARLEWRVVGRASARSWGRAAALTAPVFAAVALAAWAMARAEPALAAAWRPTAATVWTLAAAASFSVTRRAAVLGAALAVALAWSVVVLSGASTVLRHAALTLLAAGLPAVLVRGLMSVWPDQGEDALRLELAGAALLSAGTAYAAGLSPFVVSVLMSALLVSIAPRPVRRRVRAAWRAGEFPVYAVFLVLAGALLRIPTPWLIAAALGVAVVRTALHWAAWHFGGFWPPPRRLPARLWRNVERPGAAAIALAAGFDLVRPGGGALLATVVIGVVVADALAAVLPPLTASPRGAEVT